MNPVLNNLNETPVIGILTLPISKWVTGNQKLILKSKYLKSYIPNAAIEWIESAGAQVVPIQYNLTKPIMTSILKQVNGVVIGGEIIKSKPENLKDSDIDIHIIRYSKAEFHIFNYAKEQNANGYFFPLFGVAGGAQDLLMMEKMPEFFKNFKTKDNAKNIKFPKDTFIEIPSKNKRYPLKLTNAFGILNKNNTSMEYQKTFKKNNVCYSETGFTFRATGKFIKSLKNSIYINSLAKTKNHKLFINMFTFQQYPFYGTLFHPEAIFHNSILNQTKNSIPMNKLSLLLSERFVNDARKNHNKLLTQSILIYNYTLFSPQNVIKILFPDQWQVYIQQFNKEMPVSYFFGLTSNKKLL